MTEAVAEPALARSAPPAFSGNLSLIGQAKSARDAVVETPGAAGASLFRGAQATNPVSFGADNQRPTPVGRAAAESPAPRSVAPERAGGIGGIVAGAATTTAGPLFTEALTPPVAGPVVAGSTRPSVVPNATGMISNVGGAVTAPGGSDVVVLSAFTVTADHAVGFATAGSGPRMAPDKRQIARRDDLPPPPTGAKFGRNTEAYSYIRDNDFLAAAQNPLSTFAIDVDSASYANVRRIIELGSPPPRDAVRIEELVNYFPYRYAAPKDDAPFAASLEVADAPWAPKHRIVRIGLKAREVSTAHRPPANLVFLLDVSGSMNQPNKLPLVKESLRLLLGRLRADDRVAIVTYAGNSGLALSSTPVAQKREILNALDALTPGGSTNGAMGIQLAYEIAKANFVGHGINRVILCTDGDFNVGATSEGELVRLIEDKATSGVFLTVLGFGMGNYKDATLEKLADKGNGNYGYIDTRREAEKLLVEQVSSTLMTVAKDVKIQVEFNPATVSSYRLIGYENRLLRKEDFNNDSVDAGEIGAGHTVTALYEIVPVGAEEPAGRDLPPVDELRYGARGAASSRLEMPGRQEPHGNELLTVKVRYKKPDSLFSFPKTLQFPLVNASKAFARASADFRFAAAVAQFGMILRGSPHRGSATMRDVATWAASAAGAEDDPGGYRSEFLELVYKAQTMME
jgi:Ca-activated chloride channel family protein